MSKKAWPSPSPDRAAKPAAKSPAFILSARVTRWMAVATCAALLITFAMLSWIGVRNRSATFDEPMHGPAALVLSRYHDFRVNHEDPPLWQHWASLTTSKDALKLNFEDPDFKTTLTEDEANRWSWCGRTMYETPGNDADGFLARLRIMLILLGVIAGGVIAWWGWQLGGGLAAVVSVALFAFDPNFLAHAAQIKNDVALSLVMLGIALSVWRAGRRLTIWNTLAVLLTVGAAPATKFSGVTLLPVAAALLFVRACFGGPWNCFGRELLHVGQRVRTALWISLSTIFAAWGIIWACYDFRFAPAPDGSRWVFRNALGTLNKAEIRAKFPGRTDKELEVQLNEWRPGPFARAIAHAEDRHLLPQTWLYGFLHTYATTLTRSSFLEGKFSETGFASYFPMAHTFKTPVGTQAALYGSAIAGLIWAFRRRTVTTPAMSDAAPVSAALPGRWWAVVCLLVPAGFYLSIAMRSNINIGIRHILPIYPPLYVAAGWAWSLAARRWGRPAGMALGAMLLAAALETGRAAPDFLAFFNAPSGGSRGGLTLLSDSNLDWGQDLPALAAWQRANPDRLLRLSYFGSALPKYYGIKYVLLEPSPNPSITRDASDPRTLPNEPGIAVISATYLQGLFVPPQDRNRFRNLLRAGPIEVLGGSIYLFDLAGR